MKREGIVTVNLSVLFTEYNDDNEVNYSAIE